MSFGLSLTNDNGEVLIDSDVSQLHFAGKYTPASDESGGSYQDHSGATDNAGGNFPYEHLNAHGSTVGHIYKYNILVASNSNRPPMCFIKPTSTGSSAPYTSIIRMHFESGYWKVEVLQSTQTTPGPTLYVFTTLDQLNLGNDSYGFRVMNDLGEVTFNSQNKPLRIKGSGEVTTPSLARVGSTGSGWLATLDVNCTPTSMTHSSAINANNQMYYVPSIAHCALQYSHSASDSGVHDWDSYSWARSDLYWAFYRSAFRLRTTTKLECSYAIFYRGHIAKTAADSGWVFGFESLLGNVDSYVGSAGMVPYTNSSRNTNQSQSVIITDSTWYD